MAEVNVAVLREELELHEALRRGDCQKAVELLSGMGNAGPCSADAHVLVRQEDGTEVYLPPIASLMHGIRTLLSTTNSHAETMDRIEPLLKWLPPGGRLSWMHVDWLAETETSAKAAALLNADFLSFLDDTGYATDIEKRASLVFRLGGSDTVLEADLKYLPENRKALHCELLEEFERQNNEYKKEQQEKRAAEWRRGREHAQRIEVYRNAAREAFAADGGTTLEAFENVFRQRLDVRSFTDYLQHIKPPLSSPFFAHSDLASGGDGSLLPAFPGQIMMLLTSTEDSLSQLALLEALADCGARFRLTDEELADAIEARALAKGTRPASDDFVLGLASVIQSSAVNCCPEEHCQRLSNVAARLKVVSALVEDEGLQAFFDRYPPAVDENSAAAIKPRQRTAPRM